LSTYTERIHAYYMRLRPSLVLVVRGGRELRVYSTDRRVADEGGFAYLPEENIQRPHVHFSLEYSSALLVEVPQDPEAIPDIAYQLAKLAQLDLPKPCPKLVEAVIEPEDPAWARRILESHGAKVYENWRVVGDTALLEAVLSPPYVDGLLRARRLGA